MTLLSTRLPSGDRSDGRPIIEPDTTRGAVQLPSAPRPIRQRPPHTPVVVLLDPAPQPAPEPKQKPVKQPAKRRNEGSRGPDERQKARPPEVRAKAVELYLSGEMSPAAVAKEVGVSRQTVNNWLRDAGIKSRQARP